MPADSAINPPSATPSVSPPRRRPRWLWWVGLLSLAVVLTLFLLPAIIAHTPLRHTAARLILNDPRLRIEIGQARLGWTTPAEFQAVELYNLHGEPLANAAHISVDHTLWELLWLRPPVVHVILDTTVVTVQLVENRTNFRLPPRPEPPVRRNWLARRGIEFQFHFRDAGLELIDRDGAIHSVTHFPWIEGVLRQVDDHRWLIIQPVSVLDQVTASRQLADAGLKYAAPILADVAWVGGTISLRLNRFRLNLDAPAESEVHGVLTLHNVETGPHGAVASAVLRLVGEIRQQSAIRSIRLADESEVYWRLSEGRVHQQGLTFGLPDIATELVFQSWGSVGLDETLDMRLLIPLPWHLVSAEPLIPGRERQVLEVPIRGTLSSPQLELTGEGRLARLLVSGLAQALTGESVDLTRAAPRAAGWLDRETIQTLEPLVVDLAERLRDRRRPRIGLGPRDDPVIEPQPADDRPVVGDRLRRLRDLLRNPD